MNIDLERVLTLFSKKSKKDVFLHCGAPRNHIRLARDVQEDEAYCKRGAVLGKRVQYGQRTPPPLITCTAW